MIKLKKWQLTEDVILFRFIIEPNRENPVFCGLRRWWNRILKFDVIIDLSFYKQLIQKHTPFNESLINYKVKWLKKHGLADPASRNSTKYRNPPNLQTNPGCLSKVMSTNRHYLSWNRLKTRQAATDRTSNNWDPYNNSLTNCSSNSPIPSHTNGINQIGKRWEMQTNWQESFSMKMKHWNYITSINRRLLAANKLQSLLKIIQ
jgi:hypothetical protein